MIHIFREIFFNFLDYDFEGSSWHFLRSRPLQPHPLPSIKKRSKLFQEASDIFYFLLDPFQKPQPHGNHSHFKKSKSLFIDHGNTFKEKIKKNQPQSRSRKINIQPTTTPPPLLYNPSVTKLCITLIKG